MPSLPQRLSALFAPIDTHPGDDSRTAGTGVGRRPTRHLYSAATASSWGEAPKSQDEPGRYRSYLADSAVDGSTLAAAPRSLAEPPDQGSVARRGRRRRPKLAGLTAFPTPRGLWVAHGGKLS